MKNNKLFLSIIILFLFSAVGDAQILTKNPSHVSGHVSAAQQNAMHQFNLKRNSHPTERTTSLTPVGCWYDQWDQNYVSGVSVGYYFDIYPDSNLIDDEPPLSGPYNYIYYHGMGMCFDPSDSSYYYTAFNYPVTSPLPDTVHTYTIDSIAFQYLYIRNNSAAVGDSLIVEVSRTQIGSVPPDSGSYALTIPASPSNAAYCYDSTPRFGSLRYDPTNNDCADSSLMTVPNERVRLAIPLTAATLTDTVAGGVNYFIQSLGTTGIQIIPGTYCVAYAYFKSGVSYPFGTSDSSANFIELFAGEPLGSTVPFMQSSSNSSIGYAGSYNDGLASTNLLEYFDTVGFAYNGTVDHLILIPSYGVQNYIGTSGFDVMEMMFHVVYYYTPPVSVGYFIDTCGVILSGNFVQTGISQNGSFGSSVPLPANIYADDTPNTCNCDNVMYHGLSLGFVSDPDMNGWTVGSPPYFGDYFLPGNSFEGWSIELGGIQYNAYQSNLLTCGSPYTSSSSSPPYALTGNNVSYTTNDSLLIGTWQGNLGGFLNITQLVTLDTNTLFLNMDITITNTDSTPVNDLYYWRVINPQNEAMQTGNFATNNTIEYQMPDSENAVLVSATGPTFPQAYIALGTSDTNAKCFISETWPPTQLADQYYSMTGAGAGNTYCQGCTDNGDYGIGLVYYIAHLAPADSASDSVYSVVTATRHPANTAHFNSIYSFSKTVSDSVLKVNPLTHYNNSKNKNELKIFPNPLTQTMNISTLNTGDKITVCDITGRVLRVWYADTNDVGKFDLSDLLPGSYLIIVQDNCGQKRLTEIIEKL